jgi:predicted DNA-binding transcriptional regulator AlpA
MISTTTVGMFGDTMTPYRLSLQMIGVNSMTAKVFMSEVDAAEYIGMSRSYLRQDRMNGFRAKRTPGPPFVRMGSRIKYIQSDLDTWIEQNRVVHVDPFVDAG